MKRPRSPNQDFGDATAAGSVEFTAVGTGTGTLQRSKALELIELADAAFNDVILSLPEAGDMVKLSERLIAISANQSSCPSYPILSTATTVHSTFIKTDIDIVVGS